jgi:hypothetical protein
MEDEKEESWDFQVGLSILLITIFSFISILAFLW